MGRWAKGQVIVRRNARGRVYALRFQAYSRREFLTLGTSEDGRNRAKAKTELENVLADVRRRIWQPPTPEPAPMRDPPFREFASDWLDELAPSLRARTVEDYEWRSPTTCCTSSANIGSAR
jgi:hypothetical protein